MVIPVNQKSNIGWRDKNIYEKVGILENSARGVWALTTVGRELQEINSDEIVKRLRGNDLIKDERYERDKS